MTTGDFNGDGKPDLAMASANSKYRFGHAWHWRRHLCGEGGLQCWGNSQHMQQRLVTSTAMGGWTLLRRVVTVGTVQILTNNPLNILTATTICLVKPQPGILRYSHRLYRHGKSPGSDRDRDVLRRRDDHWDRDNKNLPNRDLYKNLQFAGTHAIRAVYNGNTNYATSSSAVI